MLIGYYPELTLIKHFYKKYTCLTIPKDIYDHAPPLGYLQETIARQSFFQLLGNVFACLAECESSKNPLCHAKGTGSQDVFGILQLGEDEFKGCREQTDLNLICNADSNIHARINQIASMCKRKTKTEWYPSGIANLREAIDANLGCYGIVPPKPRKDGTIPPDESKNYRSCMKNLGFDLNVVDKLLKDSTCDGCTDIKGCGY